MINPPTRGIPPIKLVGPKKINENNEKMGILKTASATKIVSLLSMKPRTVMATTYNKGVFKEIHPTKTIESSLATSPLRK